MKKYIIANWKMSLTAKESVSLAKELADGLSAEEFSNDQEVVVCPSATSLGQVAEAISDSALKLGGQNAFWEDRGAYTGEISPAVLKELGADYLIIGHSERRNYLKETNKTINQKVKAALALDMKIILCVGETFEERKEGKKDFVINYQVITGLNGIKLDEGQQIIVAYEPVWVIGSGQAVKPDEAEHTCQVVRQALLECLPAETVNRQAATIYGGSVNHENIADFMKQPHINGALVGGASLSADSFIKLIKASNF